MLGHSGSTHLHVRCFFFRCQQGTEQCKQLKYGQLSKNIHFVVVAFETLGAIGLVSLFFLKELGHRRTGDLQSYEFLIE